MYGADRHWNIRDSLTTFGAVWLALTLAGGMAWSLPWPRIAPALSLLIYAVLLAAYARWTGPGRRSASAYFLGALLLPIVCIALLIILPVPAPESFLVHCWELIFDGFNVGFQFHGGPDTPFDAYVPLMYLNILLPIVAVIGGRAFVRYHRPD
jgi:hypothetical protein